MNGSIERVVKKSQFVPSYVSWTFERPRGKAGDLAGCCCRAVVHSGAREGVGCGASKESRVA